MPREILKLVFEVIPSHCKRRSQFGISKHRARAKTTLGLFFNHTVQGDAFTLWGVWFILLVDECVRYKFVDELKDKSFATMSRSC